MKIEKCVQTDQLEAAIDGVRYAKPSKENRPASVVDNPLISTFGGFSNRLATRKRDHWPARTPATGNVDNRHPSAKATGLQLGVTRAGFNRRQAARPTTLRPNHGLFAIHISCSGNRCWDDAFRLLSLGAAVWSPSPLRRDRADPSGQNHQRPSRKNPGLHRRASVFSATRIGITSALERSSMLFLTRKCSTSRSLLSISTMTE